MHHLLRFALRTCSAFAVACVVLTSVVGTSSAATSAPTPPVAPGSARAVLAAHGCWSGPVGPR